MRLPQIPAVLRRGALPWLTGLALAGLGLAQVLAIYRVLPGVCGALTVGSIAALTELSLRTTGLGREMLSWGLMLAAMMPPLVSGPVNHVLASSLPKRRLRGAILVMLSYSGVWLAAGLMLVPLAIATMVILPKAAFPVVLALAMVWSCTPVAQRARNACHRVVRIGLTGWRADLDCLRQGFAVAPWCVASCWPWMLVAMVAGRWHIAGMAAVTVFLLIDRLLPPAPVRWRLPPSAAYLALSRRA